MAPISIGDYVEAPIEPANGGHSDRRIVGVVTHLGDPDSVTGKQLAMIDFGPGVVSTASAEDPRVWRDVSTLKKVEAPHGGEALKATGAEASKVVDGAASSANEGKSTSPAPREAARDRGSQQRPAEDGEPTMLDQATWTLIAPLSTFLLWKRPALCLCLMASFICYISFDECAKTADRNPIGSELNASEYSAVCLTGVDAAAGLSYVAHDVHERGLLATVGSLGSLSWSDVERWRRTLHDTVEASQRGATASPGSKQASTSVASLSSSGISTVDAAGWKSAASLLYTVTWLLYAAGFTTGAMQNPRALTAEFAKKHKATVIINAVLVFVYAALDTTNTEVGEWLLNLDALRKYRGQAEMFAMSNLVVNMVLGLIGLLLDRPKKKNADDALSGQQS